MTMDKTDKAIISYLQENGRISLSKLGRLLGMSHVGIRKRLKKLIENEMIHIDAELNVEKLNLNFALIFVEISRSDHIEKYFKKFINCPRIVFMAPVTGEYNLMVLMVAENLDTIQSIAGACSIRIEEEVRKSQVIVGTSPIYPRYLPIRIIKDRNISTTPCGLDCSNCSRFTLDKCLGCPATKNYKGNL